MDVNTWIAVALVALQGQTIFAGSLDIDQTRYTDVPDYGPQPNAPYMVDNTHNYFHVAPDKGKQDGPVWDCSGSFEQYMDNLRMGDVHRCDYEIYTNVTVDMVVPLSRAQYTSNYTLLNQTVPARRAIYHNNSQAGTANMESTTNTENTTAVTTVSTITNKTVVFQGLHVDLTADTNAASRSVDYWLTTLAPLGQQPLAPAGYKFYRDVVKDYKADNTGKTDASEAINAAIQDGNRCGKTCSSTFTMGAIVYFPPGTYKICSPVIQLYYTQFIGDAIDVPTIKGCSSFKGIALFDTDPYIPGGSGSQWYINQNQFFRHIRNFIFDLTEMPLTTNDNDQALVPTGIHWQAAQATTLQNLVFNMPKAKTAKGGSTNVTHVGIFMENGSGGFVSDLVFNGGAIGWRAGSQQYTARSMLFNDCQQAVQMVWDWGFNWQGVRVNGGTIGFNISGVGGSTSQGIGSTSIIDCTIESVPIGILTHSGTNPPAIVLDNVKMLDVDKPVANANGDVILTGSSTTVDLWATGRRYNGSTGSFQTGPVTAPRKSANLIDNTAHALFIRSRPQYETVSLATFSVATAHGIKNDGTGDQTAAINAFLQAAVAAKQIAYFPAGIYQVGGTLFVPTGSRIQGSSWSQIQGSGFYFADIHNPQVMVRVGNKGDIGNMEIVEMLFTVKGATAGAILMEWNVAASSPGSAAMWDSHFRIGGGTGTDLDVKTCPKGGFSDKCIAATLMLHVTRQASGYFENVWTWAADHDNDMNTNDVPDPAANQISIYAGRGMLIESQGPSWFYGTGSEHTVFYQYQVYGARDIYLGHIQTETPYYQPNPVAPAPFGAAPPFPGDPSFDECTTDTCKMAWGLRVIDSQSVTVHGAGLYSFFNDYTQDCVDAKNCQDHVLEVKGSTGVVIFNLFTVAVVDPGTGINNSTILQSDSQSGFSTEISVWTPLLGDDTSDVVYVGTEVWSQPTARCDPPCILVLPPSKLPSGTTIAIGVITTSFEYGHTGTTNIGGQAVTSFFSTVTSVTITVPAVTISAGDSLPYSNVHITDHKQTTSGFVAVPSVSLPPVTVPLPDGNGGTTMRTATLAPWPQVTLGPDNDRSTHAGGGPVTYHTPVFTSISAAGPTVTTVVFPPVVATTTIACPTQTAVQFATPQTRYTTSCAGAAPLTIGFTCVSKVVTFLGPSGGALTQDCTYVGPSTITTPTPIVPVGGGGKRKPTTTGPTTTTPLVVYKTWPPGDIVTVTTDVPKPKETDGGYVLPCNLWFLNFCPGGVKGWKWTLPPGIYPPGPPPWFKIDGTLIPKGTLPPWPRITVGPGGDVTYPDEPDHSCQTLTGSMCGTTTVVSKGPSATATSVSSRCETIRGCSIKDSATDITTTTSSDCKPTPTKAPNSDDGCSANAVIYPRDTSNVGEIPTLIKDYNGKISTLEDKILGKVIYYFVPMLDYATMAKLQRSPDVAMAYYIDAYYMALGTTRRHRTVIKRTGKGINNKTDYDHGVDQNNSQTLRAIVKRTPVSRLSKTEWGLSQVSVPPGKVWKADSSSFTDGQYVFNYNDNPAGGGQRVYIMNEATVWVKHPELKAADEEGRIIQLPNKDRVFDTTYDMDSHGSVVVARILGSTLGTCAKCTVVWMGYLDNEAPPVSEAEEELNQLQLILDDVRGGKWEGKATLSMTSTDDDMTPKDSLVKQRELLQLLDEAGVVIVVSSGNEGEFLDFISGYPQRFGDPTNTPAQIGGPPIVNMILVGSSDGDGRKSFFSQDDTFLTTYAPGEDIQVPTAGNGYKEDEGTSFSTPAVAGLVAYWRSLPSKWQKQLEKPANVKKLLTTFHRKVLMSDMANYVNPRAVEIIWNGQSGDNNCLVDYDAALVAKNPWMKACPQLPDDLAALPPGAAADGPGQTLTFSSSIVPSPTCTAGGCGTLCTGYYCSPHPTQLPPDFLDPKDPNNDGLHSTTVINTAPPSLPSSSSRPPSTPTSSTLPPAPKPSIAQIFLSIEESTSSTGSGVAYSAQWTVTHAAIGAGTGPSCSVGSADFELGNADTSAAKAQFPPSLGPITFKDAKMPVLDAYTCRYEGTEQAQGFMICNATTTGGVSASCVHTRMEFSCFGSSIVRLLTCSF